MGINMSTKTARVCKPTIEEKRAINCDTPMDTERAKQVDSTRSSKRARYPNLFHGCGASQLSRDTQTGEARPETRNNPLALSEPALWNQPYVESEPIGRNRPSKISEPRQTRGSSRRSASTEMIETIKGERATLLNANQKKEAGQGCRDENHT